MNISSSCSEISLIQHLDTPEYLYNLTIFLLWPQPRSYFLYEITLIILNLTQGFAQTDCRIREA